MKAEFRDSPVYHQLCYNHAIHLSVVDTFYNEVEGENNHGYEFQTEEIRDEDQLFATDDFDISSDADNDKHPYLNENYNSMIKKIRFISKKFRKSIFKNKIILQEVKKYVVVQRD